jgi:FkbM family methyltransferase
MTSLRHRLILGTRRIGIEDSLRSLHALRSRAARRDRRDLRNMRLLFSLALAEDACCVDIGANMGVVLRDIVRVAPRGRHIAYEPLPELAAELARDFPQVEVRQAAVSDHMGEATFYRHMQRDTRSGLSALDYGEEQLEPFAVRLEDLDSSLPDDFVPALVKIDVEGAEEQVIRGAAQTLARHRPIVVFEHDASARHFGTSSEQLQELLTSLGLRLFDIDGRGPYGPSELAERVNSGAMWTFVAHR